MLDYLSQIRSLQSMLQGKEISCTQLTQAYLDAMDRDNPKLNAYVTATPDAALAAAKRVDEKLAKGETLSPLEGIPMTLKDNISTKDIPTTCCSKILEGYVPIYDATVWKLLKEQNAVLLGKTNMDEFAMGSSCETSCFGGAANPHNLDHVAGGSSGGVASAVGGNLAAYGLGSDTGGSIRQPASFCGLVGLKPTYGAVSRFGLVAYASSLDQIGPITTNVEDTALVYDQICQYDPMDSTSKGAQGNTASHLKDSVQGKKIGIAKEYLEGLKPEVEAAIQQAVKTYEAMGCELVEISLPALKYALPVYYILACAEASSNLGRYDGIRYGYQADSYLNTHDMICKTRSAGFGKEVQRRILLGTYVLSSGYYDAYYKKALQVKAVIKGAFDEAFQKYDLLLTPVSPTTAPRLGESLSDPLKMYLSDIYTVSVNLAGLPGLSMPCGFDSNGLPIGAQLIGPALGDLAVLDAAHAYQQETDWHRRRPGGQTARRGDLRSPADLTGGDAQ